MSTCSVFFFHRIRTEDLAEFFLVSLVAAGILSLLFNTPVTLVAAQSLSSWNPNVSCGADLVTVQSVLGSSFPSQSLNGSVYKTSSTTGGVSNKRALSPPCTLTNTSGQVVSSFVQINGVYLTNYFYETRDCNTSYDAVNGGGSFPNGESFCDSTGNVLTVGTTSGFVHVEFDRDWMAKGYCGPGHSPCDNSTIIQSVCTISSPCSSTRSIDVQGFVFWDNQPGDLHWELHPFTAWRLSPSSVSTSFTHSPSSPSAGSQVTFTASATGGAPPYTFSWNFGDGGTATGGSVTHSYTVKGSYVATLTTRDSAGALAAASSTITVAPLALQGSFSVAPPSPTVGSPGTFNSAITGGTSPYTVKWNFGDGTTGTGPNPTHTYAAKGTYTARMNVTDANGTFFTTTRAVTVSPQTLTTSVTCGSATTGKPVTCKASANGGTSPYTFAWSAPGGLPATGTGASFTTTYATKGTFVLNATATDANGVKKSQTTSVVVAAQPIVVTVTCGTATAGKPVICTASATGGTAPYTFTWASKGTPATGTGTSYTTTFASKGSQVVNATAKDTNNVSKLGQATVNIAGQPIVVTVTCGTATAGKPVTCNASATGGTSPYTFYWSAPGGTSTTGTGASFTTTYATKGAFIVNATDTDGNNVKKSQTASIVVAAQPIIVTVTCGSTTAGKPVTCNASATGGASPYTFSWSAPGGSPVTGTGASFTTTYTVKGTDVVNATATDANGVKKSQTASITVSPQPVLVTVTCASATAGKPVTCSSSASGGTSPYTFSWSAPGGSPSSGTGSSFTTTYATKGSFTVNATATDANGVKKSATATIGVSAQSFTVTVTCGSATAGKPVICNAPASGGTPPFTFTWSAPGGSPVTGSGSSFTTTYATKGTFVVNATATDANNSHKIATASIVVAGQPNIVTVSCGSSTAGKPVTCSASATGGTSPYTFSWSVQGGTPASGTGTGFTTTYATKGSFVVNATVTDGNGAKMSQTTSVVVAAQPLSVTVTCGTATVGQPVTCNASATGGTAPYTFSWSAPGGRPFKGTGPIFTTTYSTKGARTVNATATDANGAKKFGLATVNVQGTPLAVTVTCGSATVGKPATCNASVTGGTTPYTFFWSAPGGSQATGTGANFTTTYASKGTFIVNATATDANTAQKSQTANIVVGGQPIAVTVTCGGATAGKPVTCNASASGGTGPYTFSWSTPTGLPATGTSSSFTTTYATKGTDVVNATATDANGLKKSQTANILVAAQPIVVTVTCASATAGSPVTCHSAATGGTLPYTFSWSAPNGNPATGSGSRFNVTFASKGSFTVNVTATDANNVETSSTASIAVAPQPITLNIADSSALAVGTPVGSPAPVVGTPVSFTSAFAGGTGPYTILWRFGDGSNSSQSSPSHTYSAKGVYTVTATVTDANGAGASSSIQITVSAQMLITSVSCGAATAGKPVTCNASVTGGIAPYTFSWSTPTGLPATGTGSSFTTTYATKGTDVVNATATDSNGVTTSQITNIVVAAQPLAVTVSCGTATEGKPVTCNASATGGTSPYTISWSTAGGSPVNGTGASFTTTYAIKGSYMVNASATDSNGAQKFGVATVGVATQAFTVTVACGAATAGKPVTCSASASGGTSPYTFTWAAPGSNPATGTGTSFTTTYPTKGTFVVNITATDANNSYKSGTGIAVVVAQPIAVSVTCGTATAGKPVNCNASASGGTAPFTFSWSAVGGSSVTGTGASFTTTYATKGTYVVNATATDTNGAVKSQTASVTVTAQPVVVTVTCGAATAAKPLTCNALVTGGTSPYTFTWGSKGSPATGAGSSYTTTFASKGSQTINATATDTNSVSILGQATDIVAAQPLVVTVTCPTSGVTAGKPFSCTVSATGGTAPYSGTGSFSVTQPVKGSFTETFGVTDVNGVTASGSASVTVAPQPLVVTATCPASGLTAGKPFSCSVSATGGTGPYSGTGSFSVTQPVKGTFTESFSVTDANGVTASGSASVTVASQPLVVTVTCGTATAGKPVTCSLSASGGTSPYAFSWSNPGGTPATGTGASLTTTYATKGTFVLNATTTDANNVKGSATATISVAGQPLVVTVTCGTATAGKPVTCNASATGGTSPYTFSWASKGSPATGTGSSYTTTFAAKGLQTVNATVTDVNSVLKLGQATIIIAAQPIVVTENASPAVGNAGQKTTFSGSASGGTTPYLFRWDFGDNSTAQYGISVSHVYVAAGNYTVTLTVTDANAVATGQTQIYSVGPPLPFKASFSWSPPIAFPGHNGNFTATASGGVGPYSFSWSFGDNTTGTGVSVQHSYSAAPVNYTVSLLVTDSKGSTGTVSRKVLVWRTPDLDGDGKVTILDVARVAFAFDSKIGDRNYDPRADLNGDGKVNILDLQIPAFYFDTTGW